jgi:hypothetical protein
LQGKKSVAMTVTRFVSLVFWLEPASALFDPLKSLTSVALNTRLFREFVFLFVPSRLLSEKVIWPVIPFSNVQFPA